MDSVGSEAQRRRIQRYEVQLRSLSRTAGATSRSVSRDFESMDRRVSRSLTSIETKIDRVQGKLAILGQTTSSPRVELAGVSQALAQVEALSARLRALSGQRVTPRVGVGGAIAGGAVARAASGGGGGGGGTFYAGTRGVGFGRRLRGPLLAGLIGLGVPGIRGLVGGAGAGILSAGAGIAGASAVAPPAISGLGAMLGIAIPTLVQTAGSLSAVSDAAGELNSAITEHGRRSREARVAQEAYNRALGRAPKGTERFFRARERLSEDFRDATGPARRRAVAIGRRTFGRVRRGLLPTLGPATNQFFGEADDQSDILTRRLTGPLGRRAVEVGAGIATDSLGPLRRITEGLVATLTNLSQAARPLFREFLQWSAEWTETWASGTRDIDSTRHSIERLVDHFRVWARMTSSFFRLMKTLGGVGGGAREGTGLIESLGRTFDSWERLVRRNPGRTREWFAQTADDTRSIARSLSDVVGFLDTMGEALRPLLRGFEALAKLTNNLGLAAPGILGGALAARRVLRGPAAAAGAGGLAGAGPVAGTAAGGLAGLRASRAAGGYSTYGLARSFGRGRIASSAAQAGSLLGSSPVRAFAGRFLPISAAFAGLDAYSFQGGLGDKVQAGLSSFTLGAIPRPATDDERTQGAIDYYRRRLSRAARGAPGSRAAKRRVQRLAPKNLPGLFGPDVSGLGDPKALREMGQEVYRGALEGTRQGVESARTRRTGKTMDILSDLSTGFQRRVQSDKFTPEQALAQLRSGAVSAARDLKPEQQEKFARGLQQLTSTIARDYPNIAKGADNVTKKVVGLSDGLKLVNGTIADIGKENLPRLLDKMTSDTQKAARQTTEGFTQIETKAIAALRAMGYSGSEARGVLKGARTQGAGNFASRAFHGATGGGFAGGGGGGGGGSQHAAHGRTARGGRLPGSGRQDNVALATGGWLGAPGELVMNRHSEAENDALLGRRGATAALIARQRRRHSDPPLKYARGGRLPTHSIGALESAIRGLGPYSTSRGGAPGVHAPNSLHYSGLALDVNADGAPGGEGVWLDRLYNRLRGLPGIAELIWRAPDHYDHLHLGLGAGAGGGFAPMGTAFKPLRAPRTDAGGMGGFLGNLGLQAATRGANRRLRRAARQGGVGGGGAASAGGEFNKARLARLWIQAGGPPGVANIAAAVALAESGGNPGATGPLTSYGHRAAGLWQIHPPEPGSYNPLTNARQAVRKYQAAGGWSPWEAYTNGNYQQYLSQGGRVSWAGWNAKGGRFTTSGPTMFGAGERGREEVSIRPVGSKRAGGKGAVSVTVSFGDVHVSSKGDADALAKRVANEVGAELLDALRKHDLVAEGDLAV